MKHVKSKTYYSALAATLAIMWSSLFSANMLTATRRTLLYEPSTAVGAWWNLYGAIPLANCVAAYQPVGAASLADSYINLVSPGTYDAAPGVAPTWDAVNGWKGDGATTYLRTGIIPGAGWSFIVRFSDAIAANTIPLGSNPVNSFFYFSPTAGGASVGYRYGSGAVNIAPALTNGTIAEANGNGYRNGVFEINVGGAWTGIATEIYLLALHGLAVSNYFDGYLRAAAIYSNDQSANMFALDAAIMALPL